jgi:hypothetical protein
MRSPGGRPACAAAAAAAARPGTRTDSLARLLAPDLGLAPLRAAALWTAASAHDSGNACAYRHLRTWGRRWCARAAAWAAAPRLRARAIPALPPACASWRAASPAWPASSPAPRAGFSRLRAACAGA